MCEEEKKKLLQSTIYNFASTQKFYGSLLQELTIKYTEMLPTAAISYNIKSQTYEIYINPLFFGNLTAAERVAVFHHEILHFVHKHLFILPFTDPNVSEQDKKIYNVAGDMAINQYIDGLPVGAVNVNEWKLDTGLPFPKMLDMTSYYNLIKEESKKQDKNTKGNVNSQLDKFKDFDQHFWESLDEETKQKMLEEAKRLFKRTIEKVSKSHTTVPDAIVDMLESIEAEITKINYKKILQSIVKKTVSCVDRASTWKKPNKRYGMYSPGTKVGNLPKLDMYIDTSGSISVKEMHTFLRVVDEFLKVGTRQCYLNLWHTELYHRQKYKLNEDIDKETIEAGGTDVTCALEAIIKNKSDLSIILTDGCYSYSDVKPTSEIVWIISENGSKNHPLQHVGKTIPLEKIL